MASDRTLKWRERYNRRMDAMRQMATQRLRDPVPVLSTPDEAYVYRERLAILCGPDRDPTELEMALAQADILRFRKENEGRLI